MTLRNDVLEIRFELEERQINFLRNFLGTLKNFLLDERNIFLAVAAVNRAVVVNTNVRQLSTRILGIQMLKDGIKAVDAARYAGTNPPRVAFATSSLLSGGAISA